VDLVDFFLVALGVWALWDIRSAAEDIADELADIRRILDEPDVDLE
jgi:hypothetical protein